MTVEFPLIHQHLLGGERAVALLFPGQGSQFVGMVDDLVAAYPAAQAAMAEADEILGFALSELCQQGPEEVLTDTINAQPALLAASVAILRALESELEGLLPQNDNAGQPVFVAGHSLGEYTALVAAGSLSYADGLRLVRERGRLMKEAGEQTPGMMAAVLGLEEEAIAAICGEVQERTGGVVQVANDNCPGQVVISGDRTGMEAAMVALEAAGARRVVPLAVSVASHSPLMAPAASALQEAIAATSITPPRVPLIANTTARPLSSPDEIRQELASQLTGSVRWTASMRFAVEAGVTDFVELGPGDVLTKLMRRIDSRARRHTVNTPGGVRGFADWLRSTQDAR